jgi:diguanylate cyclase (GGDEF)-like protein/PAS domain S-box-containing protein
MLVEDEVIVAMDVQQRLEGLGYLVVAQATTGEEAVQLAVEMTPDLILMDVKIRGSMDGIQTAAKIRQLLDIPIVYLTAFSDELTVRRASQTEAFGYMIKPFEDRELRSTIEVAIYKHKTERKLRESEERYALAARATNDGIWDWNLRNDQIYYSPRWKTILGISEDLILQSPADWFDRIHPADRERFDQAIWQHLERKSQSLECEYRILHQDGTYRWMLCRALALFDDNQRPYRIAGSQADITIRKQIEEQLTHRASHDELTNLPNRAFFINRLTIALQNARRGSEHSAAVLFLDIDHFKLINDSLGHGSGDALLREFALRIRNCLQPNDVFARFGGDEFAILIHRIQKEDEATRLADNIQAALQTTFMIDGLDLQISTSIGIVFLTSQYQLIENLMRDVDAAMYHAKLKGRARYEVFQAHMHEDSIKRLQMEAEIRRAIHEKEFVLYYQPIFQAGTLELMGFEALLRWQHPVRGLLFPGDFIHIAEESGLVVPIGEWVLHTACKQAKAWQQMTGLPLKMAVNLSAAQFNNRKLVPTIRSVLSDSGFNPNLLELELTESVAMTNYGETNQFLSELRASGISISIDDFGSGYSSLDHIRFLPASTLKIDRAFIKDLAQDNSAIVTAIITMAHQLQLQVIAEGVESKDQLSMLQEMQCDQVQGFFLSKPAPPETIFTTIF